MINALLWTIGLLVLALVAEMVAHFRAVERAARAERALARERRRTDRHWTEARRMLRDAREAEHFASLPRNGQIPTVDEFLRDLFGGR